MDKIPYRLVQSVGFIPYSSDEVRKISALEVNNASIFDVLDHPTEGGLYDRALGPTEMRDICKTCGLSSMHCPGHCGHISLPLPVFNPLFLGILNKILRGSCLSCHRLTAPTGAVQLALHQFQALDYGLIGTVQQLEEMASDPTLIDQFKSSADLSLAMSQKLKETLEEAISGIDMEKAKTFARVKNVVETRQRIMKKFIRDHLTGSKGKCPHCGVKKKALVLKNNCRFILSQGQKKISIRPKVPAMSIKQEKDAEETANATEVSEDAFGNVDLNAKAAKAHMYALWVKDGTLLGRLFSVLRTAVETHANPVDIFFTDVVLIPPSRFRPINVIKSQKLINPKTAILKEILQDCILLKSVLLRMKNEEITDGEKDNLSKIIGKNDSEKLYTLWYNLQGHVNAVLDAQLDKQSKDKQKGFPGVKQILEAKEGLFRGRMMGKRVNYVARSVISPDPFIMVDEVGIPEIFAKKLTYPEPVTPWNVDKLRAAVLNGPDVHPGAVAVESEDGRLTRLSSEEIRYSLACRLLTPEYRSAVKMRPKTVHRHLQNGDILLLNRQPTLHKPSIMAHRARVLHGEKTLRLHYANCKSYNADFDGDEMNAHFPQNEIARSEGYNIVSVNHQYLVPKDGTPLSGLIQDHIVAGTLLTMRGTFFTRKEYMQLVYSAIPFVQTVKTLPPSILKPQVLWSGKQVVSTVIINVIPKGKQPITVEGKAKLSNKNWQNAPRRYCETGGILENDDMSESEVVIQSGELLCGVLDKAQTGPTPYGLVHCCYELYGGQISNLLLSSFARLFTYYLKEFTSFTLGVEDILLTDKATRKRERILKKVKKVGVEAAAKALNVVDENNSSEILQKLRDAHFSRDPSGLKQLDFEMKKKTDHLNNEINKVCMPDGLQKKFPKNNLQLLVQAGAKGSTVNTMQISCLLGQVELEGRRVPLMLNGSTLPCFRSYNTSPRAGGFVTTRFLNAVRPQEYYFHCMAGREGLIDTAVKTSRSGYLQRCLIKHLEGVMVNYDMTVRDSDGSVIQFLYGEDGLDVTKMQMLKAKQLPTLAKNYEVAINKEEVELFRSRQDAEDPALHKKAISNWRKKHGTDHGIVEKNRLKKPKMKCPDPVASVMRPDTTFGSVSEKLDSIIDSYIKENPNGLISREKKPDSKSLKPKMFRKMMYYRALKALAQPGEPVGLLAAQSIGEPSTQMTLNTFHFAGRGEMNVTLGIPRLREILMVASANIATPSMDLPLLDVPNVEKKAEKLRVELTAVRLNQVLEYVEVTDEIHVKSKGDCCREYKIKMKLLPRKAYEGDFYTSPEKVLNYIEKIFIKKVVEAVRKKLASMTKTQLIASSVAKEHATDAESETDNPQEIPVEAEGASSDEEEEADDDDTLATTERAHHNQDVGYEDKEEEDNVDNPSDEEEEEEEEGVDSPVDPKIEESEVEENTESGDSDELHSKDITDADKASRISFVQGIHRWISTYDYNLKKRKCEFSLKLDLENSATDMKTLVEDVIRKAVVHELPRVNRAFLVRDPHSVGVEKKMLKTEGVNFLKIFPYDKIIDMRRIYSNDIHAIASFLGVEAAARAIVKEVSSVFAIYGIQVDPRHLLLIADYMTFDGTYKPFNRFGLESNASPLQQMSFETTVNFFRNATLTGAQDMLKSPSSKLIVGQLVGGGTGSFDVFVKPYLEYSKKK